MENKNSTLAVAAVVVAGLSLIFALVAFGRIAGMAHHNEQVKRELVHIQEMVRTENAKLGSRQNAQQRDMDSLEARFVDLQMRLENIIACVRTGKCTGQLG